MKKILEEVRQYDPSILFVITRSTNTNLVCYKPKYRNGRLDRVSPLDVFWFNKDPDTLRQNNNQAIEQLSWMESKFAYGYTVKNYTLGCVVLSMVADPKTDLSIIQDLHSSYPSVKCMMGTKQLKGMFIQTVSGFIKPSVSYVDLFYQNTSGTLSKKRKFPS